MLGLPDLTAAIPRVLISVLLAALLSNPAAAQIGYSRQLGIDRAVDGFERLQSGLNTAVFGRSAASPVQDGAPRSVVHPLRSPPPGTSASAASTASTENPAGDEPVSGALEPVPAFPHGSVFDDSPRSGQPMLHGGWVPADVQLAAERFGRLRTSGNSPRSWGPGEPLQQNSWLNRPLAASAFFGMLHGDELISNQVDQSSGSFGGVRLGYDLEHYWGMEARAGWSEPGLSSAGDSGASSNLVFLDASLLYYPWGDSRLRPYFLAGMGTARVDFNDQSGLARNQWLFGLPLGFGVKYLWKTSVVFRAEFLDNIVFGSSGVNDTNNLSFTLSAEYRFGGRRVSYYPWQASHSFW